MNWLAELFETNRIIVLSVYGQVFFVMGLAVALQAASGRAGAGPSARLAGGIRDRHGLMAWGYLFVPIQAGFLPLPVIELLLIVQLLMKPLAFGLLFQFGVEIMLSTRDPAAAAADARPGLRFVPALVVVMWAVATVALSTTVAAGFVPDPGRGCRRPRSCPRSRPSGRRSRSATSSRVP